MDLFHVRNYEGYESIVARIVVDLANIRIDVIGWIQESRDMVTVESIYSHIVECECEYARFSHTRAILSMDMDLNRDVCLRCASKSRVKTEGII